MKSQPLRSYALLTTLSGAAIPLACSDDGRPPLLGDTPGSDGAGGQSGTSSGTGSPGAGTGGTGGTAGGGPASAGGTSSNGDGSPTTSLEGGAADTSDTAAGDTGAPPASGICGAGPFPASPFPNGQTNVTAMAVAGTTIADVPGAQTNGDGVVEGPVWLGDSLVLTHFPFAGFTSEILRYTPGTGAFELAVPADAGVNGLALRSDGVVIGASHSIGGLVTVDLSRGEITPLVTDPGGRFNSPNDLTLRDDGNVYFTDPDYQSPGNVARPTAAYRVDPAGAITMIEGTDQVSQPNGISLSPAGDVLYVAHQGGIERYDLDPDGSIVTGSRSSFGPPGINGIDGMTVDCAGNLYATLNGQGVVEVIAPDGSGSLGQIQVVGDLTNGAFGGADRRTLFLTAGRTTSADVLFAVDLEIPGFPY